MKIPICYSPKKMKLLVLNVFLLFLAFVTIQACDDDDDDPTSPDDTGNIVEVAQSDDSFSELVSALQDAGLVSTLEEDGPFTVFAPTNDAFENLPEGLLSNLTNEELEEILSYHVIDSEIASEDLQEEQSVEALAGGELYISSADGEVTVNDSAVVSNADIEASNGVIHAVDQVLLPDAYQSVDGIIGKRFELQSLDDALTNADLVSTLQEDTENGYTVFAPTNDAFEEVDLSDFSGDDVRDILTYHVLPETVLSSDLDEVQTVTTVNGEELIIELADGTVNISDNSGNTYEVTTADLQGSNGVVHIINGVLVPSEQ